MTELKLIEKETEWNKEITFKRKKKRKVKSEGLIRIGNKLVQVESHKISINTQESTHTNALNARWFRIELILGTLLIPMIDQILS